MKSTKKITILLLVLDILTVIFLFFTYGPISYFRDLLITTAMSTKSHHYLALTLYDEKTVYEVLASNYMQEVEENTDTSSINIGEIKEQVTYESESEREILEHEEGQIYKVINISGVGYKGFVVAIYDPSRIELVTSKRFGTQGEFLQSIVKRTDSLIGINAGGFADAGGVGNGGIPTGTVIQDGKIIYEGVDTGWGGGLVGFTKDNILVLTKEDARTAIANGMEDAVEFGPFLIVNGKRAIAKGNGGYGIASRTALAQRQDGIVLFVVIDGRQPGYSIGVNMVQLTDILVKYKAYNAVNLDGGASSSLVEKGVILNRPCAVSATGERQIPEAWIVK